MLPALATCLGFSRETAVFYLLEQQGARRRTSSPTVFASYFDSTRPSESFKTRTLNPPRYAGANCQIECPLWVDFSHSR